MTKVLIPVLFMIIGAFALITLNSIPSFFTATHKMFLSILIFVFIAVGVVASAR